MVMIELKTNCFNRNNTIKMPFNFNALDICESNLT